MLICDLCHYQVKGLYFVEAYPDSSKKCKLCDECLSKWHLLGPRYIFNAIKESNNEHSEEEESND